MANKFVRIILIIILFVVFFEIGLFSSYTIVTAEAPNIEGLIEMQVSKVTSLFNPNDPDSVLIKDPTVVNISNKKDVALKMEDLSKVDGVNVDAMNITTFDDTDNDNFTVNIESLGYSSPNSTKSNQIIISQDPSYKVIATAQAEYKNGGLRVDTDTLTISSILKLY